LNNTFHLSQFRRAHQEAVISYYEESGIDSLAMYCACTLCPVLAAYTFCLEKYPHDKELTKRIEGVKLFYGVTDVKE
jgi:hypothetical protein